MALADGTRLGPYEILAPIGAGGMGEVYRAKDTRLDRTVAIKVLPSHLSGDAELRQRFEREAKAVSSLNHPHICTAYEFDNQEGLMVGEEGQGSPPTSGGGGHPLIFLIGAKDPRMFTLSSREGPRPFLVF